MTRQTMKAIKKTTPKPAVVKRVAARHTSASTRLEGREVPAGYVRPAAVKRLLAERRRRHAIAATSAGLSDTFGTDYLSKLRENRP